MSEDGNDIVIKEVNPSERMLKKLANLESTISELLSLKKATSVLKEKLSQIDELILDFPNEQEELAKEWRTKVAHWWKRYAATTNTNNGDGASRYDTRRSVNSFGPIGSERREHYWNDCATHGGMFPSFGPGAGGNYNYNRNGFGGGELYGSSKNEDHFQFASKEEYHSERDRVRAELCEKFSKLRPLESGTSTDIEALKRLYAAVRNARALTHPFDVILKEEIFCYGYRKLSPEKREKFLDQYGSNRILVNLSNFLRIQVEAYQHDLDIFKSGPGGDVGDGQGKAYQRGRGGVAGRATQSDYQQVSFVQSFGGGSSPAGDTYSVHNNNNNNGYRHNNGKQNGSIVGPNQCRYCRKEGHRISDCPEKNSKVCYTCNQTGHTSKYCKSSSLAQHKEQVTVTLLDDSSSMSN